MAANLIRWICLFAILLAGAAACNPGQPRDFVTAITNTPTKVNQPISTNTSQPTRTLAPTPTRQAILVVSPSPTSEPTLTPPPTPAPVGQIQPVPQGFVYLGDKQALALGFNMGAGGAIGSLLYQGRELVDRTDYGRYIQLSFYDGSDKYGPLGNDPYGKWGWNPIQAGSKAGGGVTVGAKVLEYRTGEGSVYIKAQGIEWGKNKVDSDVIFETWAYQRQGYFELYTRSTHTGEDSHAPATQEFPAAYFAKSLTHMYSYFGTTPFTAAPISEIDHVAREGEIAGTDNCPFVYPTENWAAFGGGDNVGLILAVPPQTYLEGKWNFCRLYDVPPVGYIGPIAYFGVPPHAVRAITYYLIPGPIESARGIVYDLLPHTTWSFDLNSFEGWQGASAEDRVENGILFAHLSPDNLMTSHPGLNISGAIAPTVSINARVKDSDTEVCLFFITARYKNWDESKSACLTFTPGEFQAGVFNFSENPFWNEGVITQLGLSASDPGVVEIDSIKMEINGQAWEFDSEGNPDGWVGWNQLTEFQVKQGSLITSTTGSDPYLGSPAFTIDAKVYPIIKIRMAVSSGDSAQLFFITSSRKAYDEQKSLRFAIDGDGEFHTYTLDMSKVSSWNGTITQIRLDPTETKSAINVDYIRIMKP
jgi:hypothetical protein